jgi:hypothetical protein
MIWSGQLAAHKRDGKWFIPASAVQARLRARKKRKRERKVA